MPHKQKIPVEEKVKIVKDCLSNRISISDAARKTGADYETLVVCQPSWLTAFFFVFMAFPHYLPNTV